MISTGPMEWMVTRPFAFGKHAFAPPDTTIGNSKTFASDVGCAAAFSVNALRAINPAAAVPIAAQDKGNFDIIGISCGMVCGFVKWHCKVHCHSNWMA
jgi:hypothetical protein